MEESYTLCLAQGEVGSVITSMADLIAISTAIVPSCHYQGLLTDGFL